MPEIRRLGAQVVGISADSHWSHKVFAKQEHLDFPLLSDWFGHVGRRYGVWNDEQQRERRVIFVIDSAGVISFQRMYGDDELPDLEPAIDVLRRLQEQEEKLAG